MSVYVIFYVHLR